MAREADYERLRRARDLLCEAYSNINHAAILIRQGDTSDNLTVRVLGLRADCEKITHAVADRITADGQPIR